jgi:hypothetical protein
MQNQAASSRRGGRAWAVAGVLLGLVLLAAPASAAGPDNDHFGSAHPITGERGLVVGSNVGATREPAEGEHGGPGFSSVWYRWTAPFTGRVVFDTCDDHSFDTLLAVYSGSTLAGLQQVAANDTYCGWGSRVVATVTAGEAYHVAVDGFQGETGSFTLRWRPFDPAAAPANDDFAAARILVGVRGSVLGTTVDATAEAGEHRSMNAATVWYRWRAPRTMTVVFTTCGSASETVVGVFRGTALGTLTRLALDDGACNLSAGRVAIRAQAGEVYHVAVGASWMGIPGPFRLRWQPGPANDDFAAARILGGPRGRTLGTTVGATAEAGEPRSMLGSTVWYRWRAPRTMPVAFSTCGASDTMLGIFRGRAVGRLTRLALAWHDEPCRSSSSVIIRARANEVYHVAVGALGGEFEPGRFELRWEPALCRVPALRGQLLARARVSLRRGGCSPGLVRYVRSPVAPRGTVVAQWPAPGTRLPYLGRVGLTVSRGH